MASFPEVTVQRVFQFPLPRRQLGHWTTGARKFGMGWGKHRASLEPGPGRGWGRSLRPPRRRRGQPGAPARAGTLPSSFLPGARDSQGLGPPRRTGGVQQEHDHHASHTHVAGSSGHHRLPAPPVHEPGPAGHNTGTPLWLCGEGAAKAAVASPPPSLEVTPPFPFHSLVTPQDAAVTSGRLISAVHSGLRSPA